MILPLAALLALAACGDDGPDGNNSAPANPRANPPPPAQ
jgi:predicted small lipoprotein YifL